MSNYNNIDHQQQYGQQQQGQYGQQPQYPNQAYGQQQNQYNQQQPQQNWGQQQQGGNYQMNQQQYPQQTYAPQQEQAVDYGSKPGEGERFNPKKVRSPSSSPIQNTVTHLADLPSCSVSPSQRVKDPFFLVFYILTVLGYCAVSGIALNAWRQSGGLGDGLGKGQGGSAVTLNASTAYLLCFVGGAAL